MKIVTALVHHECFFKMTSVRYSNDFPVIAAAKHNARHLYVKASSMDFDFSGKLRARIFIYAMFSLSKIRKKPGLKAGKAKLNGVRVLVRSSSSVPNKVGEEIRV